MRLAAQKWNLVGPAVVVPIMLAGLILSGNAHSTATSRHGQAPSRQETKALAAYGGLAASFVPNAGQLPSKVRYSAESAGYRFRFTRNQVLFSFAKQGRRVTLALRFVDANRGTRLEASGKLAGRVSYFLGRDPQKWRTGLPTYRELVYRNLWPGIDLEVRGQKGGLKYQFRLRHGADPRKIKLAYRGARSLRLARTGQLAIGTKLGVLRDTRPVSYQAVGGRRVAVESRFRLHGNAGYGFGLGKYDAARPLVIDPKVAYGSYLGGTGAEGCTVSAVDAAGYAYVACGTDSPNMPTRRAIQSRQSGEDVYVAKIDPSGSRLIYATYLGSSGDDEGDGVAIDAEGHAFVTGFASGQDFPTTRGAFDTTFNGGTLPDCDACFGDGFVSKLSHDGSKLLYSTFLGGTNADRGNTIAVRDGKAVISGWTTSSDFPTTNRAAQQHFGGGNGALGDTPTDAYVAMFDRTGSRLVFSTYLGGSGDETGGAVAVDREGNTYVAGSTNSYDFPTTQGAFKTTLTDPPLEEDGFPLDATVAKLDRRGSLIYSTYLGGTFIDLAFGLDVDEHGYAYVAGTTGSEDFPTTTQAQQPQSGGDADMFVTKLDRRGASPVFSTYLGGPGFDCCSPAVQVDVAGRAYVAGPAGPDFPLTPDAFQSAYGGGNSDYAIVRLDRTGQLDFSSYLGGSGDDGNGESQIALDDRGNLYAGGTTSVDDFPVTAGALQTTYGGGEIDGLLVKIAFGRSGAH